MINVSCDEGVLEDVHFLLHCGELDGDSGRLLVMTEGTEEWMAEWRNKGNEGGLGVLLGRSVAVVKEKVLVRIDRVVWEMCSSGWRGNMMFGT